MKRIYVLIFILLPFIQAYSQSTTSLINEGVDKYNEKEYGESEVNFLKGREKDPENFEAEFNLGDSYYKQQKYDEAIQSYTSALGKAQDKDLKSKVYHNIGNSLLKSQKIKESIEAYKSALKNNPDDADTKYNLSYALSLLNQKNDKDKKNDQNKDKNKQDQKDENQQNEDNKDQDQKNKQDQQNQQDQQQNKPPQDQSSKQDNLKQPQKNEISKEEAQRILDALKNNEKDLQKKLRKKTGVPVKTEKDW